MRVIKKKRKNIISSHEVNHDKINMLKKMYDSLHEITHCIFNRLLIFANKQFSMYWKNMGEVHLLNSEIKKFMIQIKQDLTIIFNKENLL